MQKRNTEKPVADIFDLPVQWDSLAADYAWILASDALRDNSWRSSLARDLITLNHPRTEYIGNISNFVGALAIVYAELELTDAISQGWVGASGDEHTGTLDT